MAKDKSSKEDRKAAKKAAKEALVEDAGVKKSKTDKKEKKEKRKVLAEKALNEIAEAKAAKVEDEDEDEDDGDENEDGDEIMEEKKTAAARPIGALVPFANPLADDKVAKKVFKCVKKAAAHRTLKRGVKEVVKALRKAPAGAPASAGPVGIVVLAADISPMDVISHIPVLAEDHSIPYVYVTSRAELGMAGQTKRPTSVVMVSREIAAGKKGAVDEKDSEDWDETFKGLLKVVLKEGQRVKV